MPVFKRIGIVMYQPKRRNSNDLRKVGAQAVFEYRDENNVEHRKSFWAKVGTTEQEFFDIAPETIIKL